MLQLPNTPWIQQIPRKWHGGVVGMEMKLTYAHHNRDMIYQLNSKTMWGAQAPITSSGEETVNTLQHKHLHPGFAPSTKLIYLLFPVFRIGLNPGFA